MKLVILILLLVCIYTTKIKRKNSVKNSLTRTNANERKVKLFCSNTSIKLYIENGNPDYKLRRDCKDIKFAEYDNAGNTNKCNDKSYKIVKNSLVRSSVTELKRYPFFLFWKILKFSDCKNKLELIQESYKSEYALKLKKSGSFFELSLNVNPISTNDYGHQFYDIPHASILYFNKPIGVNLDFIIDQINRYPNIGDKNIELNNEKDLVIEHVAVLSRNFIKIKIIDVNAVHEILSFCTSNGKNKYFFIAHRGAKKGGLYTSVKLHYYKKEDLDYDCGKGTPDQIDSNTKLLEQKSTQDSTISFKDIFSKLVYYTANHPFYEIFSTNCQHFATGVYNNITGEVKKTTNLASLPKVNFDKPQFFKELIDRIKESKNKDTIKFIDLERENSLIEDKNDEQEESLREELEKGEA